ncbi:MAG: polysaccharide biosynthesis/export family protein [Polyangiaceae bacterium]
MFTMRNRLTLCLAALLSLPIATLGCGASANTYDYTKEYDPRAHEYVIGAGDQLRINVWQNNDLSTEVLVRPDGTITLPLVGDIQVAGKTPTDVKTDITQKLSTFIKTESSVVTVAVAQVQSYRFTVAGQVQNPGTFQSAYYVTVAEAIAMAGGPTRFASTSDMELIRIASDGKTRRIPINYDEIQSRKLPEENLTLVAGDTVFVP